ncbi:hypothetical protein D3C71_1436110 [compost metagenome]
MPIRINGRNIFGKNEVPVEIWLHHIVPRMAMTSPDMSIFTLPNLDTSHGITYIIPNCTPVKGTKARPDSKELKPRTFCRNCGIKKNNEKLPHMNKNLPR